MGFNLFQQQETDVRARGCRGSSNSPPAAVSLKGNKHDEEKEARFKFGTFVSFWRLWSQI